MARCRNLSSRELAEAAEATLEENEAQEAKVVKDHKNNVQDPQVEPGVNYDSEDSDDEE